MLNKVFKPLKPSKPSKSSKPSKPSNDTSNVPEGPELDNFLAFHTITALLAKIQQQPFKVSDSQALDPLHPRDVAELTLSSAFATVAVMEHEVVAVVAKRDHEQLQVIACANVFNNDNQRVITQGTASSSLFSSFFFSKNPRRDEKKVPGPTIESPQPPTGLKPGDEALKKYLQKCWAYSPTMSNHLHILSQLLVMKDPSNGRPDTNIAHHTLRYVVTTCYRKMLRRMDHSTLSQPHLNFLKELDMDSITFNKPLVKQSDQDIRKDRKFLKFVHGRLDAEVMDMFPEIAKQAKLAVENQDFQLYSSHTHEEFHRLLLACLSAFHYSLKALRQAIHDQPGVVGPDSFEFELDSVMESGRTLQSLSKTYALRTHLQAIAPLHIIHCCGNPKPEKKLEKEEQDPENPDENDVDLQAVQPFVTTTYRSGTSPGEPLHDWLRLLVVHFDAVDIIIQHFTKSKFPPLSLKILVTPLAEATRLPWRALLTSPYFPASDSNGNTFKSNDAILAFLDNAISANPRQALASVEAARMALSEDDQAKFKSLVKKLSGSDLLPGWSDYVDTLKLQANESPSEALSRMNNTMDLLADNARVFVGVLDLDKPSSGVVHCEASLASLFHYKLSDAAEFENILTQMQDFGRVIGVSKRCCPACQYLLQVLLAGDKFVVRGSHSTVTRCSLPAWLPGTIVDQMNVHFGGQLRQELIEFMDHESQFLRNRAQSTGSGGLSYHGSEDSHESQHEPSKNRTLAKLFLKILR